ncbi:hypothetical protein BCV00_18200 [Vibrio breoganii]|uniref:ankyrin repeat domain-containing protein n=1 Tax=Vibrio breoganii TaxID=553239 RepID=UPI000C819A06|nr:ankyrin repeat domain-containing protein [Vibrio breoganii]PMG11287.1 hypothetical protein BCV00_18200 [Vibrio breoganii]
MNSETSSEISNFERLVNFSTSEGFPLLHFYAKHNDALRCESLIVAGLNPDHKINFGVNNEVTALMVASQFNSINAASMLIDLGASVNKVNCQGSNALHYALYNNAPKLVRLLIESGIDVNKFTCEREVWTNEFDSFHFETPLHLAASSGYLDVVKILLEHGALINSKRWGERTPIMFASAYGQTDIVKYLCTQGADVNLRCNEKHYGIQTDYSALHFAARNGHRETYEVLLKYGANKEAVECNTGLTAIEMLKNHEDTGDFLSR